MRKEAQKAPIGWEARGSRIITACFKTKNKKITEKLKLKLRRNEPRSRKKEGKIQCGLSDGSKNSTRIQSYIQVIDSGSSKIV